MPRAEAEAPQSLMYPYIKIHTARRKNVALHSNLFTICSQFNCTQLNSTKVFDNIKEPPLSDGLTTPLKIVILKIQRGTVTRRLAQRISHKVTAYFLRVGRSLCVYRYIVSTKSTNAIHTKKRNSFLFIRITPFPKGVANRLSSVTVPTHSVTEFDKNSNRKFLKRCSHKREHHYFWDS